MEFEQKGWGLFSQSDAASNKLLSVKRKIYGHVQMKEPILTYIKATMTDIDYLLWLREETMTDHLVNSGLKATKESHLQRIMYQFEHAKIITLGSQKVGLLKAIEHPDKLEIIQIQIDPKHQGKGIGRKVIGSIIEDAFSKNLNVTLSVLKENKAKNLYQRLGFKIAEENSHSLIMEATSTLA